MLSTHGDRDRDVAGEAAGDVELQVLSPAPSHTSVASELEEVQMDRLPECTDREVRCVRSFPAFVCHMTLCTVAVVFLLWGAWTYASASIRHVPYLPAPLPICFPIAKAFGRALTFCLSVLSFTAMRSTHALLRRLPYVGAVLPIDEFMPALHRRVAWISFGLALGHVAGHACDFIGAGGTAALPWTPGFCWTTSGARPTLCLVATGVALVTVFATIVAISTLYVWTRRGASPVTRQCCVLWRDLSRRLRSEAWRGPIFSLFLYFSHWTLVPVFYLLLVLHASNRGTSYVAIVFAFWLVAVAVDVAIVRYGCFGSHRLRYRTADAVVLHAAADAGGPGAPAGRYCLLQITRPRDFHFQSGQSVLLEIPSVRAHELHPFSIASSECDSDSLSFLIKADGDWTRRLLHAIRQGDVGPGCTVRLIGPHSASVQQYKGFETLILIGVGSGIAPMASLYRDVGVRMGHRSAEGSPADAADAESADDVHLVVPEVACAHRHAETGCAAFLENVYVAAGAVLILLMLMLFYAAYALVDMSNDTVELAMNIMNLAENAGLLALSALRLRTTTDRCSAFTDLLILLLSSIGVGMSVWQLVLLHAHSALDLRPVYIFLAVLCGVAALARGWAYVYQHTRMSDTGIPRSLTLVYSDLVGILWPEAVRVLLSGIDRPSACRLDVFIAESRQTTPLLPDAGGDAGGDDDGSSSMLERTRRELERILGAGSGNHTVHVGRATAADWTQILTSAIDNACEKSESKRIGVFVCAGKSTCRTIESITSRIESVHRSSRGCRCHFVLHCERNY